MDKKKLSEADICLKFITPALVASGWDLDEQVFQEFTLKAGRMVVRGQRAARDKGSIRRSDYMLCLGADRPLAVIEAKDNNHSLNAGMAQAIEYAEMLDVPFAFSSNGDGFIFRDRTLGEGVLERELTLDEFPSPSQLWHRYCAWKGWSAGVQQVAEAPWFPGKPPRYYQITAVNRTVEAIAAGRDRVLLVMATGTGKTFTAFQIIWRLWKSGAKKRILYLADRNILIDQTMVNDFKPFKGAMAKLCALATQFGVLVIGHVTSDAALKRLEEGDGFVPQLLAVSGHRWFPGDLVDPPPGQDSAWRQSLWNEAREMLESNGLLKQTSGSID